MTDKIVVLVTCGSKKEARHIAKSLVERRLAACVQEVGGSVHSTYRWKGKIEPGLRVLIRVTLFKCHGFIVFLRSASEKPSSSRFMRT